ncbi:MAG: alginate export family protein [Roseomonas sp.]|nr:alginate export family protein [Roseomonas sp.]
MKARRHAFVLLVAAIGVAALVPAQAQIGGVGLGLGGPGLSDQSALAEGQPIGELNVEIKGGQDDAGLREAARAAFGFGVGSTFNAVVADAALGRVRALPGLRDAAYHLTFQPATGTLRLVLLLSPGTPGTEAPKGILAGQGIEGFPTLWRDDRSLLRFTLNGGLGAFSDSNPWFGQPLAFTQRNPLVQNPALGAQTGSRASWFESYVEYGIGGATRIVSSDFYVYGAVSSVAVQATGQDIFRGDTRTSNSLEKLYAGVIYAPQDQDLRVNASVGRQNFTLNDGFLIAQYGAQWNAGPRPGIYLAPRTTHDMAAITTIRTGKWLATGFWLDPNEYEPLESRTQVVGGNLRYNATQSFYTDVTALYVPNSNATYYLPSGSALGREGLRTIAGHVRWADAAIVPGLWLEGELAHQSNENFPMSAWAGYSTAGYLARNLPWTPSLSYRYASFSGDNPATSRYERFDTLYSGGLNEWLQGITVNKALNQSNRTTHRVRFNVTPSEATNLTLDWFLHRAEQLNNRGGNPALAQLGSHDLGQEWQFVLRTPLSRGLYFVGVASVALPGEAIRQAAGGATRPWSSLQAQLYWNF